MKYVKIPPTVELLNEVTDKPTGQKVSFKEFVVGTLLADPQHFGTNPMALESYIEIKRALRETKEGDVIALENDHASRLQQSALTPSRPWIPGLISQLKSYFDVIKDAQDRDPSKSD